MKKSRLAATVLAGLATAAFTFSIVKAAGVAQVPNHVMESVASAKWGPAPPLLPPGAQIAVLAGNPMKAERYTVRLKFPAGYDIPAHSHPEDENVVVVSGDLFVGMGTKLDRKTGTPLGVGGFAMTPAGSNHFAYTTSETTVLLYGQGPVEFKYVNPADDPRTPLATSRR